MDNQHIEGYDKSVLPNTDQANSDTNLMRKQARKFAIISLVMLIIVVVMVLMRFFIFDTTTNSEDIDTLLGIIGGIGFFVGIVAIAKAVRLRFPDKMELIRRVCIIVSVIVFIVAFFCWCFVIPFIASQSKFK